MSGTAVPRGAISGRPTWGDAALLVTISSIGPFAANTYVPGFHAIAESLGTDLVAVQQSLSLYLIVFAVASLFVGALSDALGRKPVIVGGMLLFVVSSVAAMMSTSIEWLYACRVLQGVAASVGPVVTQAVVRDRWSGENAARVLALMTVLFGLAPAAAPIRKRRREVSMLDMSLSFRRHWGNGCLPLVEATPVPNVKTAAGKLSPSLLLP